MSFGMEIMIIVALVVYILTGMLGIALAVYYIKVFGPLIRVIMKQQSRMIRELEDEDEFELRTVK